MFRSLVNLLFGAETKHYDPVDSAVDVVNEHELGDYLLEEDCILGIENDEDQDKNTNSSIDDDQDNNIQTSTIDFETSVDEDDGDWLLVNVSPKIKLQCEEETSCREPLESQPNSGFSVVEDTSISENIRYEFPAFYRKILQGCRPQSRVDVCLNTSLGPKPNVDDTVQAKLMNIDDDEDDDDDIKTYVVDIIRVNGVMLQKRRRINSSRQAEEFLAMMQKYQQEQQFLLDAEKSSKATDQWCANKDRTFHSQGKVQDCLGNYSPRNEFTTVASVAPNGKPHLEDTDHIFRPITGGTPCIVPFGFHLLESPQFLSSVANIARFRQIMAERNQRRKQQNLYTGQPTHPLTAAVEVPQTFESNYQATLHSKPAVSVLDYVKKVKSQQKAREINIRKCLAPSQIDRQNKVKLYEGKAKNNRRKDLWRCHSGANNNRKCC